MSSHGSEEDINFIVTGRNAENSDHELKGGCRKQNVLSSKSDAEEESLNLINSDNSGSECSSPRPIEKASPHVIQGSSFTESSCSTSFKREEPGSGEKSDFNQPINRNGCLIEDNEGTEQSVQVSDRETGNCQRSMDEASTDKYHTQTQHIPTTSDFTHGSKTVSDGDFCGSPSSDYTEPELAQVSASTQDNWGLKPGKDGRLHSDSPNSDFECSSCAEDSGISSIVRDDDMEEIPLADGTISPELFQEISKLNVNDMVGSWVPKSNNTYSPNISGATGMAFDGHDRHDKSKPGSDQSSVGWKLFGKVPPKQAAVKSQTLSRDDIQRRSFENLSSSRMSKSLKKSTVANSTTALIFENRPRNLPAKSPTEEKKHRQQYEAMVAQARKKELKEVKEQEKQLKKKTKQENLIVNAASVWSSDILPNWETTKGSRKTRELWWQGIPPSVRGKVWKLAIGNDLQITHELFDIFQAHAFEKLIVTRNNKKRLKESKSVAELPTNNFIPVVSSEHKVELIMLDVSRTFPSLCIFQEGGPFHDLLHSILGAYTCYRPDVGYVQGMSFIAAVLLLNMEPPDAFICFANLLNKPCQLVFFRVDHPMMKAYFATFEILLDEFLPKIASLFVEENFSPDMYLIDWIFTLFSKSLPLDLACRVWDVFCRDGDDFLFRTALGILKYYQTDLMGMDFIHLGQFLSKLPDNISANKLFDCIASVNLNRQKFNQILTQQKELATQIKSVTASAGK